MSTLPREMELGLFGIEGIMQNPEEQGYIESDVYGTEHMDIEQEPESGDFSEKTVVDKYYSVRLYLKELKKIPLLNLEREIEIAKKIKDGKREIKYIANLVGYHPEPEDCDIDDPIKRKRYVNGLIEYLKETSDGYREYVQQIYEFRRYVNGLIEYLKETSDGYREYVQQIPEYYKMIEDSRKEMIQSNLRLVVNIAKNYRCRGLTFLDLIQEGSLGLGSAVEKFDHTKGYKFGTFAYWWIKQAITRTIDNQSRTIRLPVHILTDGRNIEKTRKTLMKEHDGRKPTDKEIAKKLGIPVDKVKETQKLTSSTTLSYDTPSQTKGEGLAPEGFIPDPIKLPFDDLESIEDQGYANELLGTLTPREEKILRMRFGIGEKTDYTLQEIGDEFGISRERVRQIEKRALGKLRRNARRSGRDSQ